MLVYKHSEGRVNTMQQRQGEEGGRAGKGEEGRGEAVTGRSVNNRRGSAERSRWPCHGDAIKTPVQKYQGK